MARELCYDEALIEKALRYANTLIDKSLPVIFDLDDFSQQVGISEEFVFHMTLQPKEAYKHYKVSKKNGGYRDIRDPLPGLKYLQKWILEQILNKVQPSIYAKAFRRSFSVRSNAKFHCRRVQVLKVDIKDFFPSIAFPKVYRVFRSIGYSKRVSGLLSSITTLDHGLPQGAPTSPALSNLVMRDFDRRVATYCTRRALRFTRYADDITISGEFDESKLIVMLRRILMEEGFKLNEKKTRVMRQHKRQIVTGIVVNRKMNLPIEYRKKLRQEIYYINKYGLIGHSIRINESPAKVYMRINGMLAHYKNIRGRDRMFNAGLSLLREVKDNLGELEMEYSVVKGEP